MKKIYLIGSLRNPDIPLIADKVRKETKVEVFDDWFAAGPEADDFWKAYEVSRGRSYSEGLQGYAARHVFEFDRHHLDTSDGAILALPAGRSGHLELGYMAGRGKRTYILLDRSYLDEDRWDCMYQFANIVTTNLEDIIKDINHVGLEGNHTTLPLWKE